MKYNFIGEDEHTFTVRHPDGSEFNIAKQAVGPGVHKLIKGLEPIKMDEGGIVDKSQDTLKGSQGRGKTGSISTDPNNPVVKSIGKAFGFAEGGEVPEMDEDIAANKDQEMRAPAEINSIDSFKNMILGTDQAQSLASIQDQARPAQNPLIIEPSETINPETTPRSPKSSAQVMPESMSDAYANNFSLKGAGIQGVADAQAQAGKQQAAAYQAQADQIAKSQAHYEQAHAALDAEHKQLTDAVMNDKIDPNRLFHNMSTGNKVLAAISVALGGLGSGLNGKSNVAMDVIQKSIDRDIDAQKSEIGKKHTLLSENLRRFGDLNAATQMTQLQMNAMTQAKVSQAASQSGSAQAQAQANMMLGDLGLQATQIKQQMAMRNAAAQGGGDPSALVRWIVPEHHQKAVFDEIQRAQDTRRMGRSIIDSFDEAAKDNTIMKTGAGYLRTPASVLSLHQAMQPTFKDLEGTVRQAAMENTFKNITPQPGDIDSTIKTKRAALEDYLKSKASAPTAKGFGIDLDKFNTTTTQSAPKTAIMNGQQYQKVPGGWKKI